MIDPKRAKLSAADERRAYAAATERDGGRCVRCGRYGDVERDHRQNRDPFNTVVSNLQLLCSDLSPRSCHRWKTEHPADAIAEGLAVPRWARPELWPGFRTGVGWVVYFDGPNVDGEWWRVITPSTATLLMTGGA